MRALDQALAVFIGASALATTAIAADTTKEYGPFSVDRAVLQGLAGTLEVTIAEGAEARLSASGPEVAVAALVVEEAAGRLTVEAPARGHSVTVVDRVTVVTGEGASSNVVIGGSSASSSTTGAPLDLVLALPAGTSLDLLGFTGDAEIGDLESSVRVEAIGGSVRIGAVRDAEFAAVGGGAIEAASVTGDLGASVTGDGRITVLAGRLEAVTVDVTGAGEVSVDAPAASAVVDMVGDGTVRLAEVASEPVVNRVGAGRFSVGPR